MGILRKEEHLFERDEEEKLIPQKAVLDTKRKEEVMITPMTRGEIRKHIAQSQNGETSHDQDVEIVVNHCIEPQYTQKEAEDTDYYLITAISAAIFKVSGFIERNPEKGDDELKK